MISPSQGPSGEFSQCLTPNMTDWSSRDSKCLTRFLRIEQTLSLGKRSLIPYEVLATYDCKELVEYEGKGNQIGMEKGHYTTSQLTLSRLFQFQ